MKIRESSLVILDENGMEVYSPAPLPSGCYAKEEFYMSTGTNSLYFPGLKDCITTNKGNDIWFCVYCGIGNVPSAMCCGQGLPFGCGAPRYEREIK